MAKWIANRAIRSICNFVAYKIGKKPICNSPELLTARRSEPQRLHADRQTNRTSTSRILKFPCSTCKARGTCKTIPVFLVKRAVLVNLPIQF